MWAGLLLCEIAYTDSPPQILLLQCIQKQDAALYYPSKLPYAAPHCMKTGLTGYQAMLCIEAARDVTPSRTLTIDHIPMHCC